MKRRVISFLTVLALCLSLCPMRAWAAGTERKTFNVTEDITDTKTYVVTSSLLLDTQGHSYTVKGQTAVSVQSTGKLYLTHGTIESKKGAGIEVQSGCFLCVDDPRMTVIGTTYGLDITSGATAELSGGTFTGGNVAIRTANNDYAALLVSGCAYFDENDDPIPLFNATGVQTATEVAGKTTVVVKKCTDHVYDYTANTGKPTHNGTCIYCGAKAGPISCTFGFNTDGSAVCADCGHTIQITITPGDLVYDGTSKPVSDPNPVTVKLDDTPLTENIDYTVEYEPRTDVGKFTVTVTGKTYNGTFTKTFGITQATPGITWGNDKTVPVAVDYDGKPVDKADLPSVTITPAHAGDLMELETLLYFSYRKIGDIDFTVGLPTDAGTYEIKANLPEQTNYEAASSGPITLTIKKINPIIKDPKAAELTYDGTAQELVTRGKVWDGAVVQFATSADGPWSTAIPTGTNATDYTVYYKIDETNNFISVEAALIADVKIQRKEITPVVELEYYTCVYDGGKKEPKVTVRDKDDWAVLQSTEYEVTYGNNQNVSTDENPATVTVTDKLNGNYAITTVVTKFQITPKDQAGLTITGQRSNVTYGDVFVLGTSGGSGNGTVAWEIISAKDSNGAEVVGNNEIAKIAVVDAGGQVTVTGIGTVTVRATRAGVDYKDATAEWTFTSGPKHVTATVTADNKTYNGNANATVTAVVEPSDLAFPEDTITITGLNGTFSDADAGTGKTVTVDTDSVEIKVNGNIITNGSANEKYIVTIPGTTTADITKAATKIETPPTAVNPIQYNGSNQALVTAATADFTTTVDNAVSKPPVEYALSKNGPWKTAVPEAIDAGGYEVWYRVAESVNWTGIGPVSIEVTIASKPVNNLVVTLDPNPDSGDAYYVYDGSEKRPAVTVTYADEGSQPKEIPSSEYTVSYTNNVNVGTDTAIVTVTDKAGGNYTFDPVEVTFSIAKGEKATLTSPPQAVANLTYNGQDQYLVSAGSATGGHLEYALEKIIDDGTTAPPQSGDYKAEIPKGTTAGEYKVYYKVKGDDNHNDTEPAYVFVTINPKTVVSPAIELNLAKTDVFTGEYNGQPQEPTVTSVKDDTNTIPETEYDVTYSNNVNAGTATVHVIDKSGGNYTVNGSITFTITKATAQFTTEPAAMQDLTYNGKAQALVSAGVSNDGTVVYSREVGVYSTAIPTETDHGTYKVWTKVLGDANHGDSEVKEINVTIATKSVTPTVTCSPSVFPYDGTEKTPNIIVMDDDGVEIPASEYTVEFDDKPRVAAGTYTVTAKARPNGNYTFTTDGTKTFKIEPADQAPLSIVTDKAPTVYYGDTFKLSAVGGSGTGVVKWSIDQADIAAISDDGVVKVIGKGSFTVTAYREGTNGSYDKSNTDSITFGAKAKPVTPVITVTDKSYDGTKTATLTASWKNGDMVDTDSITVNVTGEFVTADVGQNKQVNIIPGSPSGNNVGNYDITYPTTVTGSIYKVGAKLKTDKVPQAKTGLVYNETEQELIIGGETENGIGMVEYSLSDKGTYSTAIPTGKNAGTYTVWYRVAENVNWTGIGPVSIEVTIAPKPVNNLVVTLNPNPDSGDAYYVYDGNEKKPTVTVKDGNDTIPSSEYTVSYTNNVNVGTNTAIVTVTDKAGGNYTFDPVEARFSITKGEEATLTSPPQAVANLTYNGQDQYLVSAGSATGGKMVYAWKAGNAEPAENDYTDEIPKGTAAGEYKVYYKVKGDNNHTDTAPAWVFVTIYPKTVVSPVITLSDTSFTYDGSERKPTVTSVKDGTNTIPETEYDVTYSNNVNAGTATVHVIDKSGGNYIVNGSTTFTITKATAKFTTAPTAKTLTYNGKAQTLINAGVPEGGTAVYTLDGENGSYSPVLPTGTDRDTYTVWAKVLGDANHGDSEVKEINVAIGVNTVTNPTVELSSTSFRYNGSEQKPTVAVKDDKGNVIPANEYTVTYEKVTTPTEPKPAEPESTELESVETIDAGTYKIVIKSKTGGNYSFNTECTFTITKADQAALTITGMPSAVYYGDTIQLSVTGGTGNGTVEWNVVSGSAAHKSGGQFQITGVGNITIRATRTSTSGNYADATAVWEFEARKKPVTAIVTAEDKTYDGTNNATINITWEPGTLVGTDSISINGVAGAFVDKNVGTNKTVTISGSIASDKYEVKLPETTTASISQATAAWQNEPEAISDLVSNGSEQALVSAGTTVDGIGKVIYALIEPKEESEDPDAHHIDAYSGIIIDDDDVPNIVIPDDDEDEGPAYDKYTADIPTASKAGTYIVWYRVEDDGSSYKNWKGIEPKYVKVTIAPNDTTPGSSSTPGSSTNTKPNTETASTQTTVRNGTASTVVSAAAGNRLANEAVANQSENVVIKPEITSDVTKTEVSLPASAVSRIGNETDASLTVSTPIADVTIPNGALGTLSNAGGTVSVAAEQVDNAVVLTLTANGKDVGDLPGGLTLTVPVEDAGPGTVAVLVYEDGTRVTVRKSVAGDGGVRIPLNGSATVEIVDNSKEFADVSAESWAADAVAFASAHEMFNGTSKTTFSPELSMSRAMLATVLYNLESNPDTAFNAAFADVEGNAWYAESVSWAANCGIVTGYGNGSFGANDPITREQLAVMLWRYAGSPAADKQALDFTDAAQASGYAMEALCWAAANGILNGYGDGRLNPGGLATRAQAAQMLKNFIENT